MKGRNQKSAVKRKRPLVKTPSSTLLKYFKPISGTTPRQQHGDGAFGTPATAASCDSVDCTFATPPSAETVGDTSRDERCREESAVDQNEHSAETHGTPASDVDRIATPQTPPSPSLLAIETPPTPSSLMLVESPPTDAEGECDVNSHAWRRDQFGTPVSSASDEKNDCTKKSTTQTDFRTPSTHESANKPTTAHTKSSKTISLQSQQSKPQNKPQKQQLYLDLGQKSFASPKICPICSSLVVHGTIEDERQHSLICKSYKEGVTCLGFKKERCVARFGEERILEIREHDIVGRKKVEEVKPIVDKELGFAAGHSGLDGATSYIYISKKRIVGLLLVKRIRHAYRLLTETTNDSRSAGVSRSTAPQKAILGIHQIWVHSLRRHSGIATKLVDAARTHCVFGMVIPSEMVGFSSPTGEGLGFAKGYVGERVLVYDVC